MIEMTYCGIPMGLFEDSQRCSEKNGACSKCLRAHIARLEAQTRELDRLLASVPDLVKAAFQEGFRLDGSLGPAWDGSRAKRVLDGEATPKPPSWDRDRERISILEAKLAALKETEGARVVPELTSADEDCARKAWADDPRLGTIRFGYNLAASRLSTFPTSRVLKDGEVAVSAEKLAAFRHLYEMVGNAPVYQAPEVEKARDRVDSVIAAEFLRAQPAEGGAQ